MGKCQGKPHLHPTNIASVILVMGLLKGFFVTILTPALAF